MRDNTNHYVTGRDGGRDIDLRRFALEGMELYGLLTGLDGDTLQFQPNLRAHLDHADQIFNGINASIDKFIAANGIDAPPGGVYEPVWEPQEERDDARACAPRASPAWSGASASCRTSPGSTRRSSTAAASRCICAA